MQGEAGGPNDTRRRWETAFEAFGITVVLLFVAVLLAVLLIGAGQGGHGSSMSSMGHGGNTTSMGGNTSSMGGHGGNISMDGNMSQMGGHGPPPFVRSFGFTGLLVTGVYLVALAAWAGLRHNWTFLVRHGVSAAAMFLLVVLYLGARGSLNYDQHTWNQSFADASVVLFAVTLAISPLARLWRPASHALPWRRETGIWATIAAAMHVGIFWEGALGWSRWRAFFYPGDRGGVADTLLGDRSRGLVPTAFNLANVVGLIALVYALVLAITSNDASQRWLRTGWTWIQQRASTMWLLVLLHAWFFAYYVTFGARLAIGTIWAGFWMVLLLRTAAFSKTVWLRRLGPAAARGKPVTGPSRPGT